MKQDYKFYIQDFLTELKQHINLSEPAWLTIYEDIQNFYSSREKETFAGFLNKIFKNFYQDSNASITFRALQKKIDLEKLYLNPEFSSFDKKNIDTFINKYIEVYKKDLEKIYNSFPNGHGQKFRINKENLDILRESMDARYYKGSIGLYLKAILEEYCTKPSFAREQIFFYDTITKINIAINSQNKIKIMLTDQISTKENKKINKKFYVSPYKIVQDKTQNFNYLIGISEEIKEIDALDEKQNKIKKTIIAKKRISCFRISRIEKISIMTSMGAHISKEKASEIEKTLIEKTPQFLSGELIDIKIKFTDKGLEFFKRQLYMRPQFYEVSKEDKHIYFFHCTEMQASNYFFKFGNDAYIISPTSLRNKFCQRYECAYKKYLEEINSN